MNSKLRSSAVFGGKHLEYLGIGKVNSESFNIYRLESGSDNGRSVNTDGPA